MAAYGDEQVDGTGTRPSGADDPGGPDSGPADPPAGRLAAKSGEAREAPEDGAATDGAGAAAAVTAAPEGEDETPADEAGPGDLDGAGEDVETAEDAEPQTAEHEPDGAYDPDEPDEPEPRPGMTPRQARRVRAVVSGVVMVAAAVTLVLRLGSAPSLLTVAGYGLALILSGTAIVLSRRGRTRVATAALACGVLTIVLAERALAAA